MHYHLKLIKLHVLVAVSHYNNYGALDMQHFSVWTLSFPQERERERERERGGGGKGREGEGGWGRYA